MPLLLSLISAAACASPSSQSASHGHAGGGSAGACPPGAYQHDSPPLCIPVPAGLDRTPTARSPEQLVFFSAPGASEGRVLRLSWAKRSDHASADKLRAPRRRLDAGTFAILETQPLPRGSFWLTHDASQDPAEGRRKIPTVQGVVAIETDEHVIQCEASLAVEHGVDPRNAAHAQAAHIEACKSLAVAP